MSSPSDQPNAITITDSPPKPVAEVPPAVKSPVSLTDPLPNGNQFLEGLKIEGAPRAASNAELVRAFQQVCKPPYPDSIIERSKILEAVSGGLELDGLSTPSFDELTRFYDGQILGWQPRIDFTDETPMEFTGGGGSGFDAGPEANPSESTFGGPSLPRQDEDPFGRRASAGLINVDIESWELGAGRLASDAQPPALEVNTDFVLPPGADSSLTVNTLHTVGGNTDTLYFYRPSRYSNRDKRVTAPDMLFNARSISRDTAATFVALGWLTPEAFALLTPHFNSGGLQNIGPLQAFCFGDTLGDGLVKAGARSLDNITDWCPDPARHAALDWARAQFRMATARKRLVVRFGNEITTDVKEVLTFFSHHIARAHPYSMAAVKAAQKVASSLLAAVHNKKTADVLDAVERTYNGYCLAYAISFDRSKHDIKTWLERSAASRKWLFTDDCDVITHEIVAERLHGAFADPSFVEKGYTFNPKRFINTSWLQSLAPAAIKPFSETGEQASARSATKLAAEAEAAGNSEIVKPPRMTAEDIEGVVELGKLPVFKARPRKVNDHSLPEGVSGPAVPPDFGPKKSKGKGVDPAERAGSSKQSKTPRPDLRPKPDAEGFKVVETAEQKRARRKEEKRLQRAASLAAREEKLLKLPLANADVVTAFVEASEDSDKIAVMTNFGLVARADYDAHKGFWTLASLRIPSIKDFEFHGMRVPQWRVELENKNITLLNAEKMNVPVGFLTVNKEGQSLLSLYLLEKVGKRPKKTGISITAETEVESPFDHEFKPIDTSVPDPEDAAPPSEHDSDSDGPEIPVEAGPSVMERGRSFARGFTRFRPFGKGITSPEGSVEVIFSDERRARSTMSSTSSSRTYRAAVSPLREPGHYPPPKRDSGIPPPSPYGYYRPTSGFKRYLPWADKFEFVRIKAEPAPAPVSRAPLVTFAGVTAAMSAPFRGAWWGLKTGFMRFGADRSDGEDVLFNIRYKGAPVSDDKPAFWKRPLKQIGRWWHTSDFAAATANTVTVSTMFLGMSWANIKASWAALKAGPRDPTDPSAPPYTGFPWFVGTVAQALQTGLLVVTAPITLALTVPVGMVVGAVQYAVLICMLPFA